MSDRNRLRTRILSLRKKVMSNPSDYSLFEYAQPGTEPSPQDLSKILCLEFPEYCAVIDLENIVARELSRVSMSSKIVGSEVPPEVAVATPTVPAVATKKRSRDADGSSNTAIGGSKVRAPVVPSPIPEERFDDVCGIDPVHLLQIKNQVILPLTSSDLCAKFVRSMPCPGILLCGAPGSGKSLLARAIAGESNATFFPVSSTEIIAGISGESEERIRMIFEAAKAHAPSIIVFDDIDVICPRSANRDLERRIVAQIQNCMDSLSKAEQGYVSVVATTSKPEVIDSSLRRSGRFDIEIPLGMPDLAARRAILEKAIEKYFTAQVGDSVDLLEVAKKAAGFVGADLLRLVREAGMCAVKRVLQTDHQSEMSDDDSHFSATVEMDDFLTAVKFIEPSSRREGFSTVPSQTWEDVGSLDVVKARLEQAVCLPIRRADLFAKLNRDTVMHGNDGVLLYGPPGCGKTLLAKAVANASGASFISVKGPELLNKYVGESERAVRQVFERARISPPCVIFFDEMDALCPRRDGSSGSSGATERVVNQMLTELDGAGESNRGVIVIGATNRPDMVDPAMLRPGRLGLLMYVPLPDSTARANILRTLLRKTSFDESIDLEKIAHETARFSGADTPVVTFEDFERARQSLRASVSADEERKYLALRDSIELTQVNI
jgi:ribosome biogenesis ATPase